MKCKDTFDYRPGLPFEEFLRVFVLPPADVSGMRVALHVEQMAASRCFGKSNGEMGGKSCHHDPHQVPTAEAKEAYFRQRCQACHEKKGCTEPIQRRQAKRNDSTACHMPRSGSNVNHVALTNYQIPRKFEAPMPAAAKRLVPFGKDTLPTQDSERMRDLAVGLVSRARNQADTVRREIVRTWLPTLKRAVGEHPDDLPARESFAVALALALTGDHNAALATCEATLALAPKRELALADAELIAQRLGLNDKSLGYWKRAPEINPHSSRYRYEVAKVLVVRKDWSAAVAECRTVLAANGAHIPSRLLLMQSHGETGAKGMTQTELVTILALHRPNEAMVRGRFAEIPR